LLTALDDVEVACALEVVEKETEALIHRPRL
jgi:hypothetical protein